MGKILSKSNKNENNTDILLYQIYLPRLHENILKYDELEFFKEITIDSSIASR